jgi:hypothetical protein
MYCRRRDIKIAVACHVTFFRDPTAHGTAEGGVSCTKRVLCTPYINSFLYVNWMLMSEGCLRRCTRNRPRRMLRREQGGPRV